MISCTDVLIQIHLLYNYLKALDDKDCNYVKDLNPGVISTTCAVVIFRVKVLPGHPLYPSSAKTKESSARLRVPSSQLPRVKNSFFNGLFFK